MAPKPFWLKPWPEAAKQIKNASQTEIRMARKEHQCFFCKETIHKDETYYDYCNGKLYFRFHRRCMKEMENSDE